MIAKPSIRPSPIHQAFLVTSTHRASPVSVVVAIHNGERFLQQQLETLLADLSPIDEVILVDDASTDGCGDIISSFMKADSRIILIRHSLNIGVIKTFEEGLYQATSHIVFLCDQDDVWLPGKRNAFVDAFASDEFCLAVVSDAEVIDGDGRVIAKSFMATRNGFYAGFLQTLLRNRYLGCAMAVRRSLLILALPIPKSAPMHDMWLGSLSTAFGSVIYIPHPLIQYRRHDSNLSPARRQSLAKMIKWRAHLLISVSARFLSAKLRREHLPFSKSSTD